MRLGGPSGLPQAVAPSLAPRAHGTAGSRPAWSPEQRRKRQVRRAGPGQPSTCRSPGRPGGPVAPRPPPSSSSLLQPDFLFAASRPRLTSRAGKPPKAASFSETPRPLGSASCSPESRPRPGSPRRAAAAGSLCRRRAIGRDCLGPVARQQGALSGRTAAPGPGPRSLRKARGQPFSALEVTTTSRRRGQPDASSVSFLSRRAPTRPRPPKQRE
ncbi:unnamed protein product [Rangifer tarandus platyrhynchus]|uniref:Uncharacterized protein n=2 Tax=Rangifer tarandus platyrhynchus TaxID=3082113 RepID=A0ACB0FDS5_RANTA|nr:unnamed protein product [Rangifer tarandus platyrhynchus]CAI9710658.1 unnamed protein product [Rangifer tarandus platyrhynchus]